MNFLLLFSISLVATFVGMLLIQFFFPKWGLLDRPKKYGLKRKPLPYSAGVIVFVVFTAMVLFFFDLTKEHIGLLVGGSLITAVSFLDDRLGLSAWSRLLVQVMVGIIVVLSGIGIEHVTNPFGGVIALDMWQIPFMIGDVTYHLTPVADLFTIGWIMFVMNAVNLLDGIPGLVTGVGGIGSLALFVLSLILMYSPLTTAIEKGDATVVAAMALILFGILFVLNRFDMFPPKVIIGDTGAMMIGYLLAVFSIFAGGKVATTLIVLGLPLTDMVWVMLRRLMKGQSPMQADRNHYHHKLLRLGLSERQTLFTIYGVTVLLAAASLFFLFYFRTVGKFLAVILITAVIFFTSYLLIKKEKNEIRGF